VQNRVDVSALSDSIDPKKHEPKSVADTIIPSVNDDKMLKRTFPP
jgi:hypothetical protein